MSQRYVGRPIDYMDYEMELVKMLGFSIKKIPGRDRWGIYDESELVGTIDYRKLENRIRYKTEIYGKGLKFEEVRDEILIPPKYKLDKLYKINVRRPNGDLDKIVLHFDDFKSVYYDSCYNNCENSLIVSPQKLSISYWSHINMPSGKNA